MGKSVDNASASLASLGFWFEEADGGGIEGTDGSRQGIKFTDAYCKCSSESNVGLSVGNETTTGIGGPSAGIVKLQTSTNSVTLNDSAIALTSGQFLAQSNSYNFSWPPNATTSEVRRTLGNTFIFRAGNDNNISVDTTGTSFRQVYLLSSDSGNTNVAMGSSSTTGLERTSADRFRVVCAGTSAASWWYTSASILGMECHLPSVIPVGAENAPSLTFTGDTDTGVYQGAGNTLNMSCGGVKQVTVSDTSMTCHSGLTLAGGSSILSAYTVTTLTPVLTINGATIPLTSHTCKSVQIGKLVHVSATINWGTLPLPNFGAFIIDGLVSGSVAVPFITEHINASTASAGFAVEYSYGVYTSGTTLTLIQRTGAGTFDSNWLAGFSFTDNGQMIFTFSYILN